MKVRKTGVALIVVTLARPAFTAPSAPREVQQITVDQLRGDLDFPFIWRCKG